MLLLGQTGGRAATGLPGALPYAGGYLVTGDYVVGGVDFTSSNNPTVNGLATGTIQMSGADTPTSAHVVAAYLYWEVVHPINPIDPNDPELFGPTDAFNPALGVEFRGNPISLAAVKATSKPLVGNAAACWGAAGNKTGYAVSMLRADVLPLLPKQLDQNGQWTGEYLIKGGHTVTLRETSGNNAVQSAGATLFVVFRADDQPLRKVVIYDGLYTAPEAEVMTQTIGGFYQSTGSSARISHLVGTGGNNGTEKVTFISGANNNVVSTGDAFPQTSPNSDRSWATFTTNVALTPGTMSNSGYGETVATTSYATNASPAACRASGAVFFSTAVADIDADGLPDGLEDGLASKDPDDAPLPNLNAMGAKSKDPVTNELHKDLFIEFNAMEAGANTSYGGVVDTDGHNHMPTPYMLRLIGQRFALNGITAHFDVGNVTDYHALGPVTYTDWVDHYESIEADGYLVGNGVGANLSTLARGGEQIIEEACVVDPDDAEAGLPQTCQFPDYPGTVSWKLGFEVLRDQPTPTAAEPQRRRLDQTRKGLFHYVLYAHARGKPASPEPCLDSNDVPSGFGDDGTCSPEEGLEPNVSFHRPTTASGVADQPGGNVMVTLGMWDDHVGRPYVRAATTFHEIGHNLNLSHGGAPPQLGDLENPSTIEPNCKPNYFSSMSYLFQVHGLFDGNGNIQLDYSNTDFQSTPLHVIDEGTGLNDGALLSTPSYRPTWFAPVLPPPNTNPFVTSLGATVATRYCSGARFDPDNLPSPSMARVYSQTYVLGTGWAIDWNGDGQPNPTNANQDVNFDGPPSRPLAGYNDWSNLKLNQMSAGVNALGFSSGDTWELVFGSGENWELVFGSGDTWELSFGSGDVWELVFGSGDTWELVFGSGETWELLFGSGDTWELVFGSGDAWELVFGSGDTWELVFGSGDSWELVFGSGDSWELVFGSGAEELTLAAAKEMGRGSPFELSACQISITPGCRIVPRSSPEYGKVELTYQPPTVGGVGQYRIERRLTASTQQFAFVGTSTTTTFVDPSNLRTDEYSYRVQAVFNDVTPAVRSPYSPPVTIRVQR